MSELEIRRGDVVLVPFPYVMDFTQEKARPALVIQNDVANWVSSTVILALISFTRPRKRYPMHYPTKAGSPIALAAGLTMDSIVKAETIIPLPKRAIHRKLGTLPWEAMAEVDRALKVSLQLA